MLLSSVNPWLIIAPVIAAQYILALVAFVFLSKRAPDVKSFVLWNIFILLVFFVGSIVFLIYNRIRPIRPKESPADSKGGEEDHGDDSHADSEDEKQKKE